LVKPYPYKATNGFEDFKPSVVSSNFTYRGINSKLQDDGSGNMRIISSNSVNSEILNPLIGTVNYATGEIRLINFSVEAFSGDAIKIYAAVAAVNVSSPKSRILTIRDTDVSINFVESN